MDHRIVLSPLENWRDARGEGTKAQIENFLKINLDKVATRDVYTIHADINADEAAKIAALLVNPVLQSWRAGGKARQRKALAPSQVRSPFRYNHFGFFLFS